PVSLPAMGASPPSSQHRRSPEARLRARCRVAGVLLSLSFLIPCDTLHDGPRPLWQLAQSLRPVSTWALLAPAVAGALLLASTFVCERVVQLAIVALAAIVGLLLLG